LAVNREAPTSGYLNTHRMQHAEVRSSVKSYFGGKFNFLDMFNKTKSKIKLALKMLENWSKYFN